MKLTCSQAFTLIELLVVISIISLLSSIVLTSLVEVREKAEITRFEVQFAQIRDAIQRYENDNGELPFSGSSTHQNFLDMINLLVPEYLSEEPDIEGMREFFGMRATGDLSTQDPRIGATSTFYCEGDTNPSRYIVQFRDTQGGNRFNDDLPSLVYTSNDAPYSNFYCLFTPIN